MSLSWTDQPTKHEDVLHLRWSPGTVSSRKSFPEFPPVTPTHHFKLDNIYLFFVLRYSEHVLNVVLIMLYDILSFYEPGSPSKLRALSGRESCLIFEFQVSGLALALRFHRVSSWAPSVLVCTTIDLAPIIHCFD